MQFLRSAVVALITTALCSLVTGCSETQHTFSSEPASSPSPVSAVSGVLKGKTHGGQQPIAGAKIYLLAAGTSGYGSASTSLLTSTSYPGYPSQQDSNGRYYVLTDSAGLFQIADSCTPGQQVYVASIGGNPGGGVNTAANELAILGQCPAEGNFDSALTGVFISEVSTVAAAYATAAYATDAFDIGGPSATASQQTGIANAFANAANLFDVQNLNGTARSVTASGNGVVPQAKIHTIANILASCVNSVGPSSPGCSSLFANAKSGGATGTIPSDVTTAVINIAHNPSSGMAALIALQTPGAPFSPQLSTAPNDFAVSLTFSGAALGNNPSLAVDSAGNVWAAVPGSSAVSKLSPMGALLSGLRGYAIGGGFAGARGLAFDTKNNLWVLGQGSGTILKLGVLYPVPVPVFAELDSTGVYLNTLTETPLLGSHPPTASTNLVIDGGGNFYYSSAYYTVALGASTNCCTVEYSPGTSLFSNLDAGRATPGTNFVAVNQSAAWATGDGNSLSHVTTVGSYALTGGGLGVAAAVALDSAGNAWVANAGASSVSEFSSAGVALSTSSGDTGGLSVPKFIAVDGASNIWVSNSSGSLSLSEFTNAGAVVGTGFSASGLASAGALVLDGSGNIWMASATSPSITEFLGIAAPVVTPLAAAIGAGTLGLRP